MRPADSALGIFRSPDADLCVPGHRILRPREPWGYTPLTPQKYSQSSMARNSLGP